MSEPVNRDLRRLATELAHAFAERRHLPELIAFVVATFRELLKAEGVAILLLDRENDELYFPFSAEEDPQIAERLSRIRFPADRGIAGKVLRTGRSLRIDDAPADRWFFAEVDQKTQRTTRSLLCAPLIAAHGTIGVIEAVNPRARAKFNDDDLALLDALAQTITRAIDTVRHLAPATGDAPVRPQSLETGGARLAGRDCVFHQQGEYWTIAYAGETFRLRYAKGLAYIAHLLRYPGRELHAIDLVNAIAGDNVKPRREQPEATDHERRDLGDAGEVLDPHARADYQRRRRELQRELEEAHAFNDPGRAERAQLEIDFLTQELTRALGLGARARRAGSNAERARVNVTRAIAGAVRKIAHHHADLGRHLSATIRTGLFCSYVPDPRAPVEWVL
jgi:hypothetical protein